MGFKATFGYKNYDETGYFLEPLKEVSSQNSDEGVATIAIDLPQLDPELSYQIRYEFA